VTTARQEFDRRVEPGRALGDEAEQIARACQAMARRFLAGGKLVVFGNGPSATDAEHIAVEFVHPVIVGKRALPALSLAGDAATITGVAVRQGFEQVFAHQVRQLAAPGDIALGVSPDGACANVARGLEAAKVLGCLTVALVGGDGGPISRAPFVDHALVARSDDPQVVKEIHVTTYHILWELVHVFFEQATTPGSASHARIRRCPCGCSSCEPVISPWWTRGRARRR
jgi:D-sedoheptulose 7-phosphate isomerase